MLDVRAVVVLHLVIVAGCDCGADLGECGNGVLEPGESCDDGNGVETDDCPANCRLSSSDIDGDGFVPPEDCNDRLDSVHPGAPEVPCDGIDNDCSDDTPDCDQPAPDSGAAPDSSVPDAGDSGAGGDACQPRFDVCGDCEDQDCDDRDSPCDPEASIAFLPAAPRPGGNLTIEASAPTGYAWVLLKVVSPAGTEQWLGCPDCVRGADGGFVWSFQVANLVVGGYTVTFTQGNVDDDPDEGSPVLCAAIEVRP
ncbi:MAG: hypothetical protein HYY06_12300 [Deltaproteobacteria bacterium]|nr:hypothetical protein [Deltaproteobacteria bacterium]